MAIAVQSEDTWKEPWEADPEWKMRSVTWGQGQGGKVGCLGDTPGGTVKARTTKQGGCSGRVRAVGCRIGGFCYVVFLRQGLIVQLWLAWNWLI